MEVLALVVLEITCLLIKMDRFVVHGDITLEELASLLRQHLPGRTITLCNSVAEKKSKARPQPSEVVLSTLQNDDVFTGLGVKFEEKNKELRDAEESASKAVISIQTLHKQQQALFDEFALLRQRYDEQKASVVNILWNQCARYHPDLRQIPHVEDPNTFVENEFQVGEFTLGDLLGEGQFATVRNCKRKGSNQEYAMKIIKKERITSFTSLMRVSNEIDNLKLLKSPYIVCVTHVVHTQNILYIVTEKGGRDLFEFFDEHPDGVPEKWAREIISCVLKGVLYCHDHGICHRDLKPENILLSFDQDTEKCLDLKLCDFGLSTRFKSKTTLTDFCGSPGFFAPEMISAGNYFGDKVDVWSVGCILLELVLGHERFCDIWMVAYDYDVLQNKEQFTSTIQETVEQLPDMLNFSSDMNDFILRFLELKPSKRPTVRTLGVHPWLEGVMDEAIAAGALAGRLYGNEGRPWSPPSISPSNSFSIDSQDISSRTELSFNYRDGSFKDILVSPEVLREAYNNLSDKERRQMEEYILQKKNGDNSMKLPPIMPATPNIGQARKILRKGNELASRSYGPSTETQQFLVQDVVTPTQTPVHGPNGTGFHSPTSRSPLPSVSEMLEDEGKLASGNNTVNLSSASYSPRNGTPNGHNPHTPNKGRPNLQLSFSESQIKSDYK